MNFLAGGNDSKLGDHMMWEQIERLQALRFLLYLRDRNSRVLRFPRKQ
jgi:hypothetical protein